MVIDRLPRARVPVPPSRWRGGLALAFAIGFLVMPTLGRFARGDIESFVLVGIAGFAGVIVRPGWPGFLGTAGGLTAYVTALAAMAGFAGLHYLGLALMLPVVAAGAASGTVVNHVRAVGVADAFRDPRAWLAAAAAVTLAAGVARFYDALVNGPGGPP